MSIRTHYTELFWLSKLFIKIIWTVIFAIRLIEFYHRREQCFNTNNINLSVFAIHIDFLNKFFHQFGMEIIEFFVSFEVGIANFFMNLNSFYEYKKGFLQTLVFVYQYQASLFLSNENTFAYRCFMIMHT